MSAGVPCRGNPAKLLPVQDLTLIQLISEQTMQNLLPALRLKPRRLVHLVTPRTAARSQGLLAAARAAGVTPDVEVVRLSAMPGIAETLHAMREVLRKADAPDARSVVNFTGGTKLMSIGAFAAAQEVKAPSLYVDTQDACFMDGATGPGLAELLGGDFSFTPIQRQLRVDVLAMAHGVSRVTAGKQWQPMLPLAAHLFRHADEEALVHDALHGRNGLFPGAGEPRKPAEWLPVLDRPFRLPETAARLAVEAGLVRPGARPGEVLLPDGTRGELELLARGPFTGFAARYFPAVAPLQQALGFLTGGWWEVTVCDAAEKSGLFRDLRWSAQVGDRNGPDTEEDVLGVDGVELLYISCKRGGARARLLPLLEEIRARAMTIGGSFNRRFLAVLQPPQGRVAANLRQQAQRLGIRIITAEDVYQPGIFAR